MTLTAEDKAWRAKGIGASDARRLMDGGGLDLWLEKKGLKEPADLSKVLPVQMGVWTERYNLAWFQQETNIQIADRLTLKCVHMDHPWMRCTLDGRTMPAGNPVECKHVNAWSKMPDVVDKYMPQLQHQMAVTQANRCYLSVFIGTMEWQYEKIDRDAFYINDLITLERKFWLSLKDEEPPEWLGDIQAPKAVVNSELIADMTKSNSWVNNVVIYTDDKPARDRHEKAKTELKALLPDDAQAATGNGLTVYRTKAGVRFRKATVADDENKRAIT
jgi:predicted phage-related endonuclease